MTEANEYLDLTALTADIVASHLSNNSVSVDDTANLIRVVHGALAQLMEPRSAEPSIKKTAISVRSSIRPDYLVCLECAAKLKTLKRHLRTSHGLTPEQYRVQFGLPRSYPMTSVNYVETRRSMAKKIGLGRKDVAGRKVNAKTKANV